MVKPSTPPALFFWSTANLMPLAVDWPPVVHTGRSEPILMVPLLAPPPPPPPPQAKTTLVATVRTTSPLPPTLVLVGRHSATPHLTPPITCRPLPNSRVGARVRRRRVRPHGMAELLLRGKLSTCRGLQVKSNLRRALNKEGGRCNPPCPQASRPPGRRTREPRIPRPRGWSCPRRRQSQASRWLPPGLRSGSARRGPAPA